MNISLESNSIGIEKRELISVYILLLGNGNLYTGMTNDMVRRYNEHCTGRSRSTRLFLPVELIFEVAIEGRKSARRLECRIKAAGAKRWLNKLRFSKDRYEYNIIKEPKEWEIS